MPKSDNIEEKLKSIDRRLEGINLKLDKLYNIEKKLERLEEIDRKVGKLDNISLTLTAIRDVLVKISGNVGSRG